MKEKAPEFNYAKAYHNYAEKYRVYKDSIQRLNSLYQNYQKETPLNILDIGAGTGMTLKYLKNNYPNSKIVCIDASGEMLEIAKKEVGDKNIEFVKAKVEEAGELIDQKFNVAFCNAAFWYFDRETALKSIDHLLEPKAFLVFNISEPAIDFKDGKYDDRFLQTMVEVLDARGIVFHREDGTMASRLKLSYQPPTMSEIEQSLAVSNFISRESRVWKFTKSLEELAEFYMIPGFGTKAFRELSDNKLKKEIISEIVTRLKAEGVSEINYRWAEFVAQKN